MPSFTFTGLNTGSSVALSVGQGASTATGSVTSWGQGTLGSLEIRTLTAPNLTAPAGIWLEAREIAGFDVTEPASGEVYDPSFHQITYIWTVRGEPLSAYDAPQNIVAGWNNANVAYGKKVAFHFPKADTYTIDLWAIDSSGTTAAASTTIVVGSASSAYPGVNTVCFSNDPNETWAGESPGCQRATSIAAVQSAINSASTPVRILFKRGQEVFNTQLRTDLGAVGYIGAWGDGPRPVLRPIHKQNLFRITSTNLDQLTVTDINFQGGWDAATETGTPDPSPLQFLSNSIDCHYTISDCIFSGWNDLWLAHKLNGGPAHSSTIIFSNNVVTNWRSYGIFVHDMGSPNARLALLGTRVAQHEDALNGGHNGNEFYNNHGPLRFADNSDVYFGGCDFFSRNGWSSAPPDRADQPCLRVNFKGVENVSTTVDRCVFEGGFGIIALEGEDGSVVESPGNYLIDKALFITTAKSAWQFIATEYGGFTVRNTIGVMPNVPVYHPNSWHGAIRFGIDNPQASNVNAPVSVYSSTFVSMRDATYDPGHAWTTLSGDTSFNDVTEENNVLHAALLDTPVTAHAPIDTSTSFIPGISPRYKGVLYNPFGHESGSLNSSVGNGASTTFSYPAGTNQSYWQSIEAVDTRHALRINSTTYYAAHGEISVTFETSQIRIINTSGTTWDAGASWEMKLDRKSLLPALDATYASPATLPLPQPQTGSSAFENAGLGLSAYDDFFGNPRGNTPSAGAINP